MPTLVGMGTRRLHIKIASWNVQGLRTPAKYDQIIAFMITNKIDILMMQETWQDTSSHFQKTTPTEPPQTFLIFHSAEAKDKHAGVGFIISPRLRPLLLISLSLV